MTTTQIRNIRIQTVSDIEMTIFDLGNDVCAWLHTEEPDGRFVRVSANQFGWSDGCRESDVAAQTIEEAEQIAQALIAEREDAAKEDRLTLR